MICVLELSLVVLLLSCSSKVERVGKQADLSGKQAESLTIKNELIAESDDYITGLAKLNKFSGSVLIAHRGNVLLSKGYGMADLEHEVPNTPETKFRLASVTKQFTSMVIMILQEKGELSVHDPVCNFVPDCPAAWQEITIHHLLTHTSGIPSFTSFPDNLQYERLPTTVEKTVERFKHKALKFSPGTAFSYSNSGYVLLGYVIEQITGRLYEEVVTENIFEPLGMENSGYDHPSTILAHRAHGYARKEGKLINAIHFEMDTPHAAGGLYSTVEDLFLWDQALYTTKLVSQEALDAIFTPYKDEYGYGWWIGEHDDRKIFEHGGGISGFSTRITRIPEEKACIIVLSNFPFGSVGKVSDDLVKIVLGEKRDETDKSRSVSP